MGPTLSVLDSQALIAGLVAEPAAPHVAELLRDALRPASISALNLAEVVDVLVRRRYRGWEEVVERLAWLEVGGLRLVDVDPIIAQRAGTLRARHYHRTERPLSMADCVALATALADNDALATSDPALAATARAEGCTVVALPDSRGRRP